MSFQSAMELPKDLEKGLVVLTAFGQKELHIENHGGILEFTPQLIRVLCKNGRLAVSGERLKIQRYDKDEIDIVGLIREISFI